MTKDDWYHDDDDDDDEREKGIERSIVRKETFFYATTTLAPSLPSTPLSLGLGLWVLPFLPLRKPNMPLEASALLPGDVFASLGKVESRRARSDQLPPESRVTCMPPVGLVTLPPLAVTARCLGVLKPLPYCGGEVGVRMEPLKRASSLRRGSVDDLCIPGILGGAGVATSVVIARGLVSISSVVTA